MTITTRKIKQIEKELRRRAIGKESIGIQFFGISPELERYLEDPAHEKLIKQISKENSTFLPRKNKG